MSFNIERVLEILEEETVIKNAVKMHCKEIGIPYEEKYRHRVSRKVNKDKDDAKVSTATKPTPNKISKIDLDIETDTDTETNQYANDNEVEFVMPSAWDGEKNRFLNIDEFCDVYGLPKEQVRSSKLVAHNQSHMTYNIAFNATLHEQTGIDKDFISDIVKEYVSTVPLPEKKNKFDDSFVDRLVISDIHIGMSTEGSRNIVPLYEGKWDKEELYKRMDELVNHVIQYQRSNILVIDELGDYADGLFAQTTRQGHELPQNMSDKEVFDLGIRFKIDLIEKLLPYYSKIVFNNITEDNHSGVFGYFINSAIKNIIDIKYNDVVEFNLNERFINHYSVGPFTFLICHGKDSESLKFGFKPVLDTKQSEKIDQYCKEYHLYDGKLIEFSKGDSHQHIIDYTTSNDFVYYNYPAFSRPSNWVKSNFKNSKSGFVFQNLNLDTKIKVDIPYYFSK